MSGLSTPLSTSSTLTNPESPKDKQTDLSSTFLSPATPSGAKLLTNASAIVESIASRQSDTVFIYDTALAYGFGALTEEWSRTGAGALHVEVQNRNGAGLLLAGRLGQGSSKQKGQSGVLTAYTSPEGLSQMLPSLVALSPPSSSGRLVLQVPAISTIEPSLQLSPSVAALSALAWDVLPDHFLVLFSSTPQEIADVAALSYNLPDRHIIHIFDHFASGRETRQLTYPSIASIEKASNGDFPAVDYYGPQNATTVLIALNGPRGATLKAIANTTSDTGVAIVRVLHPWDPERLEEVVPSSTKEVHVFEDVFSEGSSGALYDAVISSLYRRQGGPIVRQHGITPSGAVDVSALVERLRGLVPSIPKEIATQVSPANLKKLVFYTTPSSATANLSTAVAHSFSSTRGLKSRSITDYDAFSKPGGVAASRIFLATDQEQVDDVPADLLLSFAGANGDADFVAVTDHSLLKTHQLLETARPHALVLLLSQWSVEEVISNLPAVTAQLIRTKPLALYTLDSQGLAERLGVTDAEKSKTLQTALAYLAFLRLYIGVPCTLSHLQRAANSLYGPTIEGLETPNVVATLWKSIFQVIVPEVEVDETAKPLKSFEFNAVELDSFKGLDAEDSNTSFVGSWRDAAQHLLFREAYRLPNPDTLTPTDQNPALRPDTEDRTYLVSCTVNKRLTPLSYNRNVFHLEFDTTGTGLKYAIGEALGVHGWNDEKEVLDLCEWYGLDPDAIVTIPAPHRGAGQVHTRTIFQALQQQIDIFGRPPKSFYTALADHAKAREHRMALRFIGAAEGSATFKKLSEVDTVTFADILKQYDSARPDFATLCELVGDIKPRHYSIASAQSAVGDRVDLLVVTVDWVTPSGSPRFGQCTRYLAGLKIGQKVTVSIKPSVMKLPPDNLQPIIMAGLGTGAAPFRAFIQHRAWLKEQGTPIGPLIYYFGSRHRSEEYLYGEELEAYIDEGVVTHAGFAFSRDQKQKIYIQHKMLEDGEMLANALGSRDPADPSKRGVFYLCGPTWPVPDVFEALVGALGQYAGYSREEAGAYLEDLKEEERYVLEVY